MPFILSKMVELGGEMRSVINLVTSRIEETPSFHKAVAKDFFNQRPLVVDPRNPTHATTFPLGDFLYRIEWNRKGLDRHAFGPDFVIVRSGFTLTQLDPNASLKTGDHNRVIASAQVYEYVLEDLGGKFVSFTGGEATLEEGFVLNDSGVGRPSWDTARPTRTLKGEAAIGRLPIAFADLGLDL